MYCLIDQIIITLIAEYEFINIGGMMNMGPKRVISSIKYWTGSVVGGYSLAPVFVVQYFDIFCTINYYFE